MIYPKNNRLMKWMFDTYVKWLVGKTFHQFLYNEVGLDSDKSVLLVANHFSFWDGLILYVLNDKLLHKKFHVMILEDTAKREGMLRYAGAFSVSKNSRDMLESLNYAAELLNQPGNLLLMFPQGKLYSNFVNRVHFEQGLLKIMKKAEGKFQILFAATFIQYLKHKKPSVTVYLKTERETYSDKTIDELQSTYQQHYDASKLQQTEIEIK
ncbi:lysophospholipid acyltransferase family protein [Mucilaginibacter sp. ZT4R22]|uniref:Lysophospholipid acyltransferase family protein n=1 Tax=Mucilaginibacter pankratovii TaxID=2772110 RepID=A0ABR7WSK0_9SPHI|nr:lysophospholipid acyltransferase family protein [Mucilaginibacter pankratovii]MBD1365288.1 lysophospholipid acyltransferase family protein [Mucilaginibacter pankratovii]